MMIPGGAMLILLPVLCLLSGASWAATLGGLGGECSRQGGGKQKIMRAIMVGIKAEVIFSFFGGTLFTLIGSVVGFFNVYL